MSTYITNTIIIYIDCWWRVLERTNIFISLQLYIVQLQLFTNFTLQTKCPSLAIVAIMTRRETGIYTRNINFFYNPSVDRLTTNWHFLYHLVLVLVVVLQLLVAKNTKFLQTENFIEKNIFHQVFDKFVFNKLLSNEVICADAINSNWQLNRKTLLTEDAKSMNIIERKL